MDDCALLFYVLLRIYDSTVVEYPGLHRACTYVGPLCSEPVCVEYPPDVDDCFHDCILVSALY